MEAVSPSSSPRPGWWGRNWKWFVPTLVIVGILTPVVCCGGIITFAFGMFKQSEPYKLALERVQQDPEVIAALGQPIEPGWLVTGNLHYEAGGGGNADLSFKVSGPQDSGTVYAVLDRAAGHWRWQLLAVNVHGSGERLEFETDATSSAPVPAPAP